MSIILGEVAFQELASNLNQANIEAVMVRQKTIVGYMLRGFSCI